jgi:glycerol-3-phosphate acyltransferase PlsY
MSFYSGFLIAVFGKLFDWLLQFVGKKIATGAAILATSLALLGAFFVALKLLVFGLTHQISNQFILQAFYALWPSNAELCLSAYWTAQVTAFVYREHRENLRAISYVT